MHITHEPRTMQWNSSNSDENYEYAKEAILSILTEQKVSLSKARALFYDILDEIEDKNIINL